MAATAGGGGKQHGLGDQQVVVEQVDEGLEEAADPGLVDRGTGDDRVGLPDLLDRGLQVLRDEAGDGRLGDLDRKLGDLDTLAP